MHTKYVMYDNNEFVILPSHVQHVDFARPDVVSAGFLKFSANTNSDGKSIPIVKCWGESQSLGIASRGDEDAKIINVCLKITHQHG